MAAFTVQGRAHRAELAQARDRAASTRQTLVAALKARRPAADTTHADTADTDRPSTQGSAEIDMPSLYASAGIAAKSNS